MANGVESGVQFLREVRIELRKVVWPVRKDWVAASIAVAVFVAFTTAFLGGTDYVIANVLGLVLD